MASRRPVARALRRVGASFRVRGWAWVLACFAILAGATASAEDVSWRAEGAPEAGEPRVAAELLFDVERAAADESFRVGVRLRMAPEWHAYWRHPGESGLATEIEWSGEGVEFSPLRWPFPQTFRSGDGFIVTYGYEDEVLLFSEARVDAGSGDRVTIGADVDLLVCKVDCIPARMLLTRSLEIGANALPSEDRGAFDAAARRVPGDGGPSLVAVGGIEDRRFTGTLRLPEGWEVAGEESVVPDASPGFETLRTTVRDGRVELEGTLSLQSDGPARVRGVAELRTPSGDAAFFEVDAPLELEEEPAAPVAAGSGIPALPLPLVFLFAFAGGALLNLMPCVFPVLAVKAYGFARIVEEGRGGVGAHGFAYALGVVGSLLLLALVVVGLRAAGLHVGWGFQFQHPLFVVAIGAVVVAFALNLFDVFQVGVSAEKVAQRVDGSEGLVRSAGEGVLAVLLATPCSAPLLGSAIGFAFAAPAWLTLSVFAVLGLGLAAPFCLLVALPGLATRLPKPGAWMLRFKQILGFSLLATAAWLATVMGGLGGIEAVGRTLFFWLLVAFGCWLIGIAQGSVGKGRAAAWVLALALPGLGAVGLLGGLGSAPEARETDPAIAWSEAAVKQALAEGRPVFVDFTADWCLTCKFNERTVLASPRVRAHFEEQDVAFLVGDWTRRDEEIRLTLASFGKAGVPLYLVYSPQRPDDVEVLPELLTEQMVIDAVDRAMAPSPTAEELNR